MCWRVATASHQRQWTIGHGDARQRRKVAVRPPHTCDRRSPKIITPLHHLFKCRPYARRNYSARQANDVHSDLSSVYAFVVHMTTDQFGNAPTWRLLSLSARRGTVFRHGAGARSRASCRGCCQWWCRHPMQWRADGPVLEPAPPAAGQPRRASKLLLMMLHRRRRRPLQPPVPGQPARRRRRLRRISRSGAQRPTK